MSALQPGQFAELLLLACQGQRTARVVALEVYGSSMNQEIVQLLSANVTAIKCNWRLLRSHWASPLG